MFYNSQTLKGLEETLKMLGGEKNLKVTQIKINKIDFDKVNDDNCARTFRTDEFCYQKNESDTIFIFDTIENYAIVRKKIYFEKSLKRNGELI